ncbi:MAG: aromatic/alkene monooxygenase hydroxylase subunit beta [Neisseriaceae bacterium]|nr:aromatic/alkene monooxygenase hydroxylase subunit beta [Neisseriaceae bacterium]
MSLEIKTTTIEPVRHTFSHIARRFGDKPATRYQEATYDAQGTTNFHYRPLWQPDKTLNDPSHTALTMQDWYAFRDPRQFYYGAYVQNRARMQENAEHSYAFFEKRQLATFLSPALRHTIVHCLLPLRHVEHTGNLVHLSGSAYGYGTAITQASLFAGMDRLGMAQYLSRIGLLLDGNTGDTLAQAKATWLNDADWQPLRALCERLLVTSDWFELLLVQTLLVDTYLDQVVYRGLEALASASGGRDLAMLTQFMQDCLKDLMNWSDSVFKIASTESPANAEQLQAWLDQWLPQVHAAFTPLAHKALGTDATAALERAQTELSKRAAKANLILPNPIPAPMKEA